MVMQREYSRLATHFVLFLPDVLLVNRIWGLAAMNAYRTYNDQQSLQFARAAWAQLNSSMVTPEDIVVGKSPSKQRSISKSCHSGECNSS